MKEKSETMRDAETLVRQALKRTSDKEVDDKIVRIVAEKVTKAIPPYPEKKRA
jgi:hypothetical protein